MFAGIYDIKEAVDIVKGGSLDRQEEVRLFDKDIYNSKIEIEIQKAKGIIEKFNQDIERYKSLIVE